jgi:MFS family permease
MKTEESRNPSHSSLRGIDWLNFFLADVQTGVGPFLAIYLASQKWNEQSVGIALTVGGIAGIVTQTPFGVIVDRTTSKRGLIAAGILGLALGTLILILWPEPIPVMAAQVLIGGVASIFAPAIAAITLGLVGPGKFDPRVGRNQGFNSAGNVFTALTLGALAYFFTNRIIFIAVLAMCAPTFLSLTLIKPQEIDNDIACGGREKACDGIGKPGQARAAALLTNKPLLIFCASAVMFHFANAAMLPLLGEWLSKGKGNSSAIFMAACVVTTQLTIVFIASFIGKSAGKFGRKPLLLLGFGVLPVRGALYTLVHGTVPLVAIQILDGVGAGIFGVLSILVIRDVTAGTCRFNAAQGAVATATGIGAALSQTVAGAIVHRFAYQAGFLVLSAVAATAFFTLWFFMPETKHLAFPATAPEASANSRAQIHPEKFI